MTKQYPNTATALKLTAVDRPKHLRPRLRRDALRPDCARALREAREAAGLSQSELAVELEIKKHLVGHSELAASERQLPSVLLVASSAGSPEARAWGVEVTRWIAGKLQQQLVPVVADRYGDDHAARLASVSVQASDPIRALAVALADGELSDDELEEIGREARGGVAALMELEAATARELERRRGGGE